MPTLTLPQYNPTQGIDTYSKILGLKQQQLALQTGQAELQTAQATAEQSQATASQAQQKNRDLANLGKFLQGATDNPAYTLPSGEPNVGKFRDDASKIAGVYGQEFVTHAVSNFTESTNARRALGALSDDQRKRDADLFTGLASKPDLNKSDILDAINVASKRNNDPAWTRASQALLTHLPPNGSTQDYQKWTANLASTFAGKPQVEGGTIDVGPSVQPITRNVYTQEVKPVGAAIDKTGIAPTVVTPPGGIPTVMGGRGHGGSGPKGPAPTDQDMKNFGEYQQGLNSRVALASDALPRIKYIEDALANVRSGGGSQARAGIAQGLQALGAPSGLVDAVAGGNLSKLQEAEKLMFQTTLSGLRQSMQGDTAHVAEFTEANKVFPNIDTDPRAKQYILDLISRQGQRDYAEQQALTNSRNAGTFNAATWQSDYQKALRAGQVPGVPASMIPTTSESTHKSKSGRAITQKNGKWVYAD